MTKIRLTRLFNFEMAHALENYIGPCKNIHGHSYRLEVTVIGTPIQNAAHPKNGMVIDFGGLKQLVYKVLLDNLDHALLLRNDSDLGLIEALQRLEHKLVLTNYQPTCENMLLDFKEKLRSTLPEHVQLHSLKLWETQNSFAEWYASDETL